MNYTRLRVNRCVIVLIRLTGVYLKVDWLELEIEVLKVTERLDPRRLILFKV